ALVTIDAVVPLITPPTTVPNPGINLKAFETTDLPTTVADPVPPTAAIILNMVALSIGTPKITVICAKRATCIGTRIEASENGIGINPTPNDVAIYLVAQVFAVSTFLSISTRWAFVKAFLTLFGIKLNVRSINSFNPKGSTV